MRFFLYIFTIGLFSQTPLLAQYEGNAPFCAERGGMIINEISNGPSEGMRRQEYIELVVVGTPTNPSAPVNLVGWLIDDNNFPAASQGTARGHIIFGDCYNAVPVGSILVIYNSEDRNVALPPDDPNDTNPKDGVYIIPDVSSCLKQCNSNPTPPFTDRDPPVLGSSLFCPCTDPNDFTNIWVLGMNNDNDVVQIRDRCETVVHAIYWDALQAIKVEEDIENSPVTFKFDENQRDKVIRFLNTVDDNWNNPLNFDNPGTGITETPGLPNSPENQVFINSLRNGTTFCQGVIYDCDDTDAGDLIVPTHAGTGLPIEILEGEDITAFQTAYTANDEFVPDALGFNFEYAYILTENNAPVFTIIDFNTSGDFDFSSLGAGTYRVWGFSYIQTNGTISVLEFLSNQNIITIQSILSFEACGFDGDVTNLNTIGEAVEIIVGARPCFTASINANNTSCPNTADGSISIELTGEVLPLQIDWNNTLFNERLALTNLEVGTYFVNITDAEGCSFSDTIELIAERELPTVVIGSSPTVCENDCTPIQLQFSGTPPYSINYGLSTNNTTTTLRSNVADTSFLFCPNEVNILPNTDLSIIFQTLQDAHCTTNLQENVALTVLPIKRISIDTTLCSGDVFELGGQIFNEANPNGEVVFTSASGCDSLVQVRLNYILPTEHDINQTLCAGEFLEINGNIYNENNPIGVERILNGNSQGCDSIIRINLQFLPPAINNLGLSICEGASVEINGTIYDVNNLSGFERLTGQAFGGCDSLISVTVTVLSPVLQRYGATLCEGESIQINGNTYDSNRPSGIERISGLNGCDTLVEVSLDFEPVVTASITTNLTEESICDGTPVELRFQFNQVGNFDVTYLEGGLPKTLNNIQNDYTISVTPDSSTTFSIQSVVSSEWRCIDIGEEASVRVSRLATEIVKLTDYNGFGVSCTDANDGAVELLIEGGVEPLDIQWSNGEREAKLMGLGAGIYQVIVLDAAGCVVTDSVRLEAGNQLAFISDVVSPTCFGDEDGIITIDTIFGGIGPYTLSFDDATIMASQRSMAFRNLSSGQYFLEIKDINGCSTDTLLSVPQPEEVIIELGEDIVLVLGDSLNLIPSVSGAIQTIKWSPSDYLSFADSLQISVKPFQTTTYQVTLADSSGCSASDQITIFVLEKNNLYVPNAFSPDGDGINDFFSVFSDSKATRLKSLAVYDRWGNLLFQSYDIPLNQPERGWNGTTSSGVRVPIGTYIYKAEVELLNEKTELVTGVVQVF